MEEEEERGGGQGGRGRSLRETLCHDVEKADTRTKLLSSSVGRFTLSLALVNFFPHFFFLSLFVFIFLVSTLVLS